MTDAGFEKVGRSEKKFYGSRKLLLCGFPQAAQPKFRALLDMLALDGLPLIWCAAEQADETVGRLARLPDGSGEGIDSALPRAIIASGIQENELHRLMSGCRQSGMQQALWAVLTPVSETWPLKNLLDELAAERRAMSVGEK